MATGGGRGKQISALGCVRASGAPSLEIGGCVGIVAFTATKHMSVHEQEEQPPPHGYQCEVTGALWLMCRPRSVMSYIRLEDCRFEQWSEAEHTASYQIVRFYAVVKNHHMLTMW